MTARFRASRIAICVTFHFSESRIRFLNRICSEFCSFADSVIVTVVTNAKDITELKAVESTLTNKGFEYSIYVPYGLGHPYFLTWTHLEIFRKLYDDETITHFLYVEDDILVVKDNVDYWLEAREALRRFGLIPSFLRFEKKSDTDQLYSTDIVAPLTVSYCPRIELAPESGFLNLPNPYQGLYFLDRELMFEHLNGLSTHPDFGTWGIREKAAQGLTFLNVPVGCTARNMVPYNPRTNQINPRCLVHHLPNNYATDPKTVFGKTRIRDLLQPPKLTCLKLNEETAPVLRTGRYYILLRDWIPPIFLQDITNFCPPIFLRVARRTKRAIKSAVSKTLKQRVWRS